LNYRFPECVTLIRRIIRRLAEDHGQTDRDHVWGAAAETLLTIEQCFNASDAMIADVSAVISDYLRSNKPFCIVSVGRSPEQLLRDAPAAGAAYVLGEDLANVDEVLSDLLGPDPLAAARRDMKVYYLGDFADDQYAEGFLGAARGILDRGVPAGPATVHAQRSGG
jgi:CDP-glycerol glycerophosphotransferase (TagB/SpsB family)